MRASTPDASSRAAPPRDAAPPTRALDRARARVLALCVLAPALLAGCVGIEVAHVPTELLTGADGNGWRAKNDGDESSSAWLGLSRVEVRVYENPGGRQGVYPATLTVATLKSPLSPSDESLIEEIRERVKHRAESNGIRLQGEPVKGERSLAEGHPARNFVWEGAVERESGLFQTQNARVKIFGEVYGCRASATSVVVIGLAQISDVRSVGGVPFPASENLRTWKDVVQDPDGSVEGHTGDRGLAWNVQCS